MTEPVGPGGHAGAPVFVVGISRSGTTLLMAMLMGQPAFALTPEWRFLPDLLTKRRGRYRPVGETLDALFGRSSVQAIGLERAAIEAGLAARAGAAAPDAIRAVMEAYAASRNRPRWGDKTPNHLLHMPVLAEAFPDAVFVHLIRDGRETADANRDAPWPPASLRFWAGWWARGVRKGRRDGASLGDRYMEVRYEDLVERPDPTFQRLLAFLGEPPGDVLAYLGELTSGVKLPPIHQHLRLPPTPGLRDWRAKWSRRERRDVEAIMGSMLDELGYERSEPRAGVTRRAAMHAWFYAVGARRRLSSMGTALRSSVGRPP